MFMPVLADLGLLYSPNTLIPVFIWMAVIQSFRSRLLSLVGACVVSTAFMAYYFGPQNVHGIASGLALLGMDWQSLCESVTKMTLTEPLETHLFVLLLFILYWLVVYASRRRRLWCFYNALAMVVLCVVDANTVVHPNAAIAIDVTVFLIVLGLLRYEEVRSVWSEKEQGFLRFFVPLIVVVSLSSAAGIWIPKPQTGFGNPIQWVKRQPSDGTPQRTIGFQTDNARLGGSFSLNDDLVLSVEEPYPAYLRGAVYARYTGKGWEPGVSALHVQFTKEVPAQALTTYSGIPNRLTEQKITVLSKELDHTDVVFGGYAVHTVERLTHVNKGARYEVNLSTGAIKGPGIEQGDVYRVYSLEPQSPFSILMNELPLPSHRLEAYPAAVLPYLELPRELPQRDYDLARQLVAGATTELDMVNRVQKYLKTHYVYQTQNIPYPEGNQDYVDQFLFETKRGYCNNFSSAMAVLLRTVQIPTRWVVGFTSGQLDDAYSGDHKRYLIRNSDAHSWVEVYFPNVGWIPFDPTPSFSMPFAPAPERSGEGVTRSNVSLPPELQSIRRYLHLDFPPQVHNDKTPSKPVHAPVGHTQSTHRTGWPKVLIGFAVLGLGTLVLILVQFRKTYARRLYSQKRLADVSIPEAVELLMKLLGKRRLWNQAHGETLRDLLAVSRRYGISEEECVHFIRVAEQVCYGGRNDVSEEDEAKFKSIWAAWVSAILAEEKERRLTLAIDSIENHQ
jgi:transglutaminase-like putative cysteine protease